jgi:hypothetical protein
MDNELDEVGNLKRQLDEVDKHIYTEVYAGFYESRLRMEWGMWEKGKAIGEYRGVNSPLAWRELERRTGRNHESLKIN